MAGRRTLGLIAGAGQLPLLFAREARQKGYALQVAAIQGAAPPRLKSLAENTIWISVGQLGSLISFFRKQGVRQAVMHGKVQHSLLFKNLRLDWKAMTLLARLKDRSGDSVLNGIAQELGKSGTRLLDCRYLMDDHLARKGDGDTGRLDAATRETIRWGLRKAKVLAKNGIGQTLVVKKKAVAAVEATEGTNEAVLRAGRWAGMGGILIKVASPAQDWRFDVPTIGPQTVQALAKARARGIVLEGGKTFLLDKAKTLALARRHKIFVQVV